MALPLLKRIKVNFSFSPTVDYWYTISEGSRALSGPLRCTHGPELRNSELKDADLVYSTDILIEEQIQFVLLTLCCLKICITYTGDTSGIGNNVKGHKDGEEVTVAADVVGEMAQPVTKSSSHSSAKTYCMSVASCLIPSASACSPVKILLVLICTTVINSKWYKMYTKDSKCCLAHSEGFIHISVFLFKNAWGRDYAFQLLI